MWRVLSVWRVLGVACVECVASVGFVNLESRGEGGVDTFFLSESVIYLIS